jgi:hypothetical protein
MGLTYIGLLGILRGRSRVARCDARTWGK